MGSPVDSGGVFFNDNITLTLTLTLTLTITGDNNFNLNLNANLNFVVNAAQFMPLVKAGKWGHKKRG